jgi:uncharacterized FlgJ-related protein
MYILEKKYLNDNKATFIKLKDIDLVDKKKVFFDTIKDYIKHHDKEIIYKISNLDLLKIKDFPFIYWFSNSVRNFIILVNFYYFYCRSTVLFIKRIKC